MTPEELNMEEIFGLSTPKKFPLSTVVEPRLPSKLYSVLFIHGRTSFHGINHIVAKLTWYQSRRHRDTISSCVLISQLDRY
ncbi:hypothetical protein H5410_019192 [Solanum commersonii]|uniref:Uncharacterized protein n=1 Tax=Solanum commersonii TaxID=4109 RepID=A0A9J6A4R5_SOLCO|nr:hypothetical protein H5410_019192 [Solanum commersonii]